MTGTLFVCVCGVSAPTSQRWIEVLKLEDLVRPIAGGHTRVVRIKVGGERLLHVASAAAEVAAVV